MIFNLIVLSKPGSCVAATLVKSSKATLAAYMISMGSHTKKSDTICRGILKWYYCTEVHVIYEVQEMRALQRSFG